MELVTTQWVPDSKVAPLLSTLDPDVHTCKKCGVPYIESESYNIKRLFEKQFFIEWPVCIGCSGFVKSTTNLPFDTVKGFPHRKG